VYYIVQGISESTSRKIEHISHSVQNGTIQLLNVLSGQRIRLVWSARKQHVPNVIDSRKITCLQTNSTSRCLQSGHKNQATFKLSL